MSQAIPGQPFDSQQSRRVLIVSRVLLSALVLMLLGLLVRVAQLQTEPSAQIVALSGSHHSADHLVGRRGNMVDRNRSIVASTGVAWRLYVDPQVIEDPGTFAEKVGYELDYDPAWVARTVFTAGLRRYVVLDHELTKERLAKAKQLRLAGLGLEMWLVRRYPNGPLAGQVIGFVGKDGDGLEGVEKLFNLELTGQEGRMRYIRDVRHRPLWITQGQYRRPTDGQEVCLSLDMKIQAIAEEELRKTCDHFAAQEGQVIVMVPQTGEILAMANYPSFDPNIFGSTDPDRRRNRCVTDVFEPGSTFKPFVWAAILEGGYATPNTIFNCGPGVWRSPQGRRLRDAYPVGKVSFAKVLIKSSNVGMAKAAARMGKKRLYEAVRAMGFGSTSGSGLIGEVPGLVNPLKKWTHFSMTSIPMGQEIGVTGLQMGRALCVIANGGLMVEPKLLAGDDELPHNMVQVKERVLSQKTADRTRAVMRRVVTEGTGRRVNSKKYAVWGKTGTAQVAKEDGRGYEDGAYTACFIGGAPVEKPRIVVVCFVKKPDPAKGYYGGVVAGPCVKNIIERTLEYLGVPPIDTKASRLASR